MTTTSRQLQGYLSFLILFCSFFWAWAVKNTAGFTNHSVDLGIVSFGTVIVMSSYVLGMVNGGGRVPAKKSPAGILLLSSHLLVVLNYAVGAYLGWAVLRHRTGFAMYCTVFVFVWLGITALSHEFLKKALLNDES